MGFRYLFNEKSATRESEPTPRYVRSVHRDRGSRRFGVHLHGGVFDGWMRKQRRRIQGSECQQGGKPEWNGVKWGFNWISMVLNGTGNVLDKTVNWTLAGDFQ